MTKDEKLRDILEQVEEQGEINAGKGEKKYIPHMTVDQALSQINQLFSEGKDKKIEREVRLELRNDRNIRGKI